MHAHHPSPSTAAESRRPPVVGAARPLHAEALAFTDAQRYAWIRSHRDDYALLRAIACADFGPQFDRLIDAAIRASQQRIRPLGMALAESSHDLPADTVPAEAAHADGWWNGPTHPHRRRGDD